MRWIFAWVFALALLAPRVASACGGWSLFDEEKNYCVTYSLSSATIYVGREHQNARKVDWMWLDSERKQGLRSMRDKQVVFDVVGDKLTKRGKTIATIGADTLTFGKRVYTITLSDEHEEHSQPAWQLSVKRGDTVVLSSSGATALCTAASGTRDERQAEIRRRVMFYLAWRETGA